ncbi:MAG: ATP-binding cassette domain-containing protein [Rhodospirillales bacterium]|nr:ATP-binding cassette domain-containing protein [Rhodospirillales bacterium]
MDKKDNERRWLRNLLKPVMGTFREVLVMSFFVNMMALAVPVFVLQIYDRVVFHAGISTLTGLVIGMMFVLVFDFILKQARSRVLQKVALRVDVELGKKLFNKVTALPLLTLESKPAPFWQALFRDVEVVRNTLSGSSAILLCDLPFVFLFLGLVFVIAQPVAWVLAIIFPIFLFIAWRSGNVLNKAAQKERGTSMSRDDLVGGMINGRTTIKALALDKAMRPLWEEAHASSIENSVYRGSKTDAYASMGQTLTLITTLSLTSVGAIAIINQELTMGALIATNMLSGRLLGPLNQLVNTWRTYASFGQSVNRLTEVFGTESEREESEVSLGRPEGEILLDEVSFSYSGDDKNPVIDKLKLTIKAKGMTALVGRNGSGKTTLIKIIMGLYRPTVGRVTLDGADIAQFTRNELSSWTGYVPQDTILFAGTVRDNIVHGSPGASDEEIIAAAEAAGVHEYIIDMPDGYATEIGEAGQRLSGGQRQRISIARALVGNPPVLLLDEPSGSLDRQAEDELRKTLIRLAEDHTIIIVTHSPILLQSCSSLVAMDRGRIAVAGPTEDILPRLFGRSPKTRSTPAQAKAPATQGAAKPAPKPAPGPGKPQAAMAAPVPAPNPNKARAAGAQPAQAMPQTNAGASQVGQKPLPTPNPAPRPAPAQAKPSQTQPTPKPTKGRPQAGYAKATTKPAPNPTRPAATAAPSKIKDEGS